MLIFEKMGEFVILLMGGIFIAFWVGVIKLLFAAARYYTKKANNSSEKNSDR